MIYRFNIKSIEKSNFSFHVSLKGNNTFADFHNCIQNACHFMPDQLASFFVAGENRGKQIEITCLDLGIQNLKQYVMDKTRIKDILHSEEQRLLYVFDFFNDRAFYIELTQISMENNLLEPTITSIEGDAPAQILEEEVQEQGYENLEKEEKNDYGDLDDYTEIFGEMEDLTEGF